MDSKNESVVTTCDFITEEVIKKVIVNSVKEDVILKNYVVFNASDKMLGFLADYWKMQVQVITSDNKIKLLSFFIKAVSKTNSAKADMVNEMKLFEKETNFYTVIKSKLNTSDISAWSPNLILSLNDAMIFEDLNSLQYKTLNKFKTFDRKHTLLALEALARFHAASIIYEEKRCQLLGKPYCINDDHENYLNKGGYQESDPWFTQCMVGALEAVKYFSKYTNDKKVLNLIEQRWNDVWKTAIRLADHSSTYRNVICHRDLWNNNILFRYKKEGAKLVPDDCVLVDFQAVRYQPPAGDVMLLLYCNLESNFRDENMKTFLSHYYNIMKNILGSNGIPIQDILSFDNFLKSCDEQKLWALVVSACLVPQFWIDDELNTNIFCNTTNFKEIMTKDKASFIKSMIINNSDYKNKVLNILEEIINKYCL
ncbi:uncharacterized protein LOC125068089 [Vanessa atalanta]|uniref:uncharacterized protein LOC125068089 n=1 Tax=Vanessa atalanta TaxID=42275 RepID=UPI001FCD5DB2|nr:uncharacterized protein LOC125068089 [Vanessa atalanta]